MPDVWVWVGKVNLATYSSQQPAGREFAHVPRFSYTERNAPEIPVCEMAAWQDALGILSGSGKKSNKNPQLNGATFAY